MIIVAEDKKSLESNLGRSWEIIDENVEEHPSYEHCRNAGLVFDFSIPTGLLSQILAIERRNQTGIVIATSDEIADIYNWWERRT